jgi:hypothetical protein
LPHGLPHVATARGGTSLHLTYTITEPTPLALVESLMATLMDDAGQFPVREHQLKLEDKAEVVAKALAGHLGSVDTQVLVDAAVGQMRKRTI